MIDHTAKNRSSLLIVGLLAGCASAEYVCPDPIGRIVRDDCEVYRTRYESLKVELAAGLGPAEAKVSLGQQQLREVSELLQVLGHRTHALCRDFNGCRVPPAEYRERRERTDRIFTAVTTIQTQLKEASLEAAGRARLVQALLQALHEDQPSASPVRSRSEAEATTRVRSGGEHYSGWLPWYGARHVPPQPPTPAGFPRLIWVDVDLEASWHRVDAHSRRARGYRPRVNIALDGKVEADDTVIALWSGPPVSRKRTEEPVRGRGSNGLVQHTLQAPEEIGLTGPAFTVEVVYRRGADGKEAALGRRTYPVLSAREPRDREPHYGIDMDPLAREGCLIFRPHGGVLPPDFDQPSLFVVLKLRKYHEASARCWVDGKLFGHAISAGRGTGQEATFQDRPRYEEISPGRSRAVADPFVQWWHYDFPLPVLAPRSAAPVPAGLSPWPRVGAWRCVVSVDGEPVRELTFRVGADGRPETLEGQTRFSRPEWLVRTQVLKNPVEVPLGQFHIPTADGPDETASGQRPAAVTAQVGRIRGALRAGQVAAALAPARAALQRCVEQEQTGGSFVLKVHVYPDGKAGANLPPGIDAWLRSCFSGAVGAGTFPRARDYTYFDLEVHASGTSPGASAGPLRVWNVRGGLTAAQLLRALGAAGSRLRACGGRESAARMKLAVGKDGKVEIQWSPSGHPAVGGCLRAELEKLTLPAAPQFTTFTLELRFH